MSNQCLFKNPQFIETFRTIIHFHQLPLSSALSAPTTPADARPRGLRQWTWSGLREPNDRSPAAAAAAAAPG